MDIKNISSKKAIVNNIKEVLSSKQFVVSNNKLYANVMGLNKMDIIYTISILKSVYAFFVDIALDNKSFCKLRISFKTDNDVLKKPYMINNDADRVVVSYDDSDINRDLGFYITEKYFYYYTGKKIEQKKVNLNDINKFIIYGTGSGFNIHINSIKDEPMVITVDADAVAMLFCIMCYLKSTSGIYSIIHHIDNFAKVGAFSSLITFVGTTRLKRDFINRISSVHASDIVPTDCIAGINAIGLNLLLTVNGLYACAFTQNAPAQKLFIDGITMKNATVGIERFGEQRKIKNNVRRAGRIIGGPVGGMIGGLVGDAITKKSQCYCLEVNSRDRLLLDAQTTICDAACMCLVLNVYSNIGRVN